MLRNEEGAKDVPYKDHLGYWTIGVGHLIDKSKGGYLPDWAQAELDKYGFLPDASIDILLEKDIQDVIDGIELNLPWVKNLDPVRYCVLVDMAFQMGVGGLLGFKNTLKYVEQGNYSKAAENMGLSLWYRQTPNRANRRIKEMRTGVFHQYQ